VAWLVGLSDMGYDKGFEGKIWDFCLIFSGKLEIILK
jgi:hypothetical protein